MILAGRRKTPIRPTCLTKGRVLQTTGHKVYRVDGVALLPLGAAAGVSLQQDTPEERRYRWVVLLE